MAQAAHHKRQVAIPYLALSLAQAAVAAVYRAVRHRLLYRQRQVVLAVEERDQILPIRKTERLVTRPQHRRRKATMVAMGLVVILMQMFNALAGVVALVQQVQMRHRLLVVMAGTERHPAFPAAALLTQAVVAAVNAPMQALRTQPERAAQAAAVTALKAQLLETQELPTRAAAVVGQDSKLALQTAAQAALAS